jgi:hypothetical protein
VCQKKTNKCPNNKKEIYNDKYRHKRDILFGLVKQISSSSHQKSEKFEDNNGIARNSSLKKDRQCNGKEKKKEKTITYSRHKIAGTKC